MSYKKTYRSMGGGGGGLDTQLLLTIVPRVVLGRECVDPESWPSLGRISKRRGDISTRESCTVITVIFH